MVLKLFSNIYTASTFEINDSMLSEHMIQRIIQISDTEFDSGTSNPINTINPINLSFGKTDPTFNEALNNCLSFIQRSISKNENILLCCDDSNDGNDLIVPVIVDYLIRSLNMNFDSAEKFTSNYLKCSKDNKYLNKLRCKFVKENLSNI